MRLDKLLTATGLTRSEAKKAVSVGRVTVDGVRAKDAGMAVDAQNAVLLDGKPVRESGMRYLMLYKPEGVITATEDRSQKTVMDILPEQFRVRDICAVGRLDRDTTGLLFLTTDGQMAHRLISPRWEVDKVYRATVEGRLTDRDVRRMAEGIPLKDFTAKPAVMEIVSAEETESVARLTVTEGKYHQVKRMFGALGHPVTRLHRESVCGIPLDIALKPGEARLLTEEEISVLRTKTEMEE